MRSNSQLSNTHCQTTDRFRCITNNYNNHNQIVWYKTFRILMVLLTTFMQINRFIFNLFLYTIFYYDFIVLMDSFSYFAALLISFKYYQPENIKFIAHLSHIEFGEFCNIPALIVCRSFMCTSKFRRRAPRAYLTRAQPLPLQPHAIDRQWRDWRESCVRESGTGPRQQGSPAPRLRSYYYSIKQLSRGTYYL